jgi:NTE family protein
VSPAFTADSNGAGIDFRGSRFYARFGHRALGRSLLYGRDRIASEHVGLARGVACWETAVTITRKSPDSDSKPRKAAIALQGGGSHGAFTWGVLDRLLEDTTIEIAGATGASAGATNAVVLADGLVRGGPNEARRALRRFWESIGKTPGFVVSDDPSLLNINPLRDLFIEMIDFDRLRSQDAFRVAVCATNVWSAKRRVFDNKDISVDAVLASACLPQMFPAVEIDGEPYWDGGWTGNPAITAILRQMQVRDLIIVRIDPIVRKRTPRKPHEILDRMIEISFNSTFWLEIQALALILKFRDEGFLDSAVLRTFFHVIEAPPDLEKLPSSSKMDNDPAFLEYLFDMGRRTADAWLAANGSAIGQRSTFDLKAMLPAEFNLGHSTGRRYPSNARKNESTCGHQVVGN